MKPTVYKRWQSKQVIHALKTRRVVVVSGARQSGKTTLAQAIAPTDTAYYTLDDLLLLEAAKSDPHGFVMHEQKLMIIDEIQRAPELLRAIKKEVDSNQNYGRFLLTGSANIQALPNAIESLAGRSRTIRLRPLTRGEMLSTPPRFLENAFDEHFARHKYRTKNNQAPEEYNKNHYLSLAFRGGYPEADRLNEATDIRQWHDDYIAALLGNDLKDVANIRRKDSMVKLLECLAAWSSKYIDISGIGASLSIRRPTIESYINALETLYLVERVSPWTKTDYARVGKKDKLFLTDTGLMASILKWNINKVRLDGEKNGKLIETYVFTQLAAIIDVQDSHYALYHYRDRLNREIDFLVENENGDYLGIEVKAGSVVKTDSFKHLRWFKENMAADNHFIGVVLYTGENIARFGEGMWAVPINALWA